MADPPAGEPVPVRFRGSGAGVDVLSWGQQEYWQMMQDGWLPIGAVTPLPPGTTVEDAAGDLAFVMGSYPSMRTRLRFDPDGPKQVVSQSGEVGLEVVEAPVDADPAQVAEQVRKRYWDRDYDFVGEWPVRMAVVRHRGALTHRVWVMCHLVTDGGGAPVILRELAARDASGSRAARTALEQAAWQRSPAGQRQSESALRWWGRVLREVPARRFPARPATAYPRFWQAAFRSPAAGLAVRVVAARTGLESSSVLLGCLAVSLARVTGQRLVVFRPDVSNRFRPGLGSTVSPVVQFGLCRVDVPDGTVDQALALARRRAMTAYKYAYYDPARLAGLREQVAAERGEPVDAGCLFNDRRRRPAGEAGPPPEPAQVRAAGPASSFEWTHRQDAVELPHLALAVNDVPEAEAISMTVTCDIHYVAPELVEEYVRGIEQVVVAAALDPAART